MRYKPPREVKKGQQHCLRKVEDAVLHGQAVARILLNLRAQGFTPDAILAQQGWGETAPRRAGRLTRHSCRHALRRRAHEGIDIENLGPNPNAAYKLPSGQVIKAGDPVITYVARNLEPYRGFHEFMRALPAIQKAHKTAHTVIVGGDEVSYGSRPKDAKNWREKMLAEVGSQLDPTRTHFLGKVPYADYKTLLQVSKAHVYLTYPFVLSWSMLEAMATGCLVIGSDTAPVREVLRDGVNGRLVNLFDLAGVAQLAAQALNSPTSFIQSLRDRARLQAGLYSTFAGALAFDSTCRASNRGASAMTQAKRQQPTSSMRMAESAVSLRSGVMTVLMDQGVVT
jgi:glycosyltransferase involved in cell wall biosynthesis